MGFLRKSKGFVNNASALVRKKSETYALLSAPTMDGVAIPNLQALSSGPDRETIKLLVEFARSQFETLGANGIELKYPGSTQLRSSLVDSFSDGRPELGTEIDKALSFSIPGGWLIGEMENASGVAKLGLSEGHYWSAMVALSVTDGQDERFSRETHFSCWAAYFVARRGVEALSEVVSASKGR